MPEEHVLFWSQLAKVQGDESGGTAGLGMGRVGTQLAGMVTSDRVRPFVPQKSMGSFAYPDKVEGSLLLTDKRLLLVDNHLFLGHGYKFIYIELMFDPDLTRQVVQTMSAHDQEVWRQYDSAGYFSKMKVLSQLWGGVPAFTGVDVKQGMFSDHVVFTVNHLYFGSSNTRKQDISNPHPVKKVGPTLRYKLELKKPWTGSAKLAAAALAFDAPLISVIARSFKVKPQDYNPLLDVAQAKAGPMVNVIRELSGDAAFQPKPP